MLHVKQCSPVSVHVGSSLDDVHERHMGSQDVTQGVIGWLIRPACSCSQGTLADLCIHLSEEHAGLGVHGDAVLKVFQGRFVYLLGKVGKSWGNG